MLELCFDMSTRGALRVAQRCGGSGRRGLGFVLSRTEDGGNVTSTTVIGFDDGKAPAGEEIHQIQRAQRRQAALEREAIPLGGSPSDVLVLSLGLDMGDIREPLGADRWDLLRRWCDGDDETTDRDWQRNLEADAGKRRRKDGQFHGTSDVKAQERRRNAPSLPPAHCAFIP